MQCVNVSVVSAVCKCEWCQLVQCVNVSVRCVNVSVVSAVCKC